MPKDYEKFKEFLFKENLKYLSLFRKWKLKSQYDEFHRNHYDWMAFPIVEKSSRPEYQIPMEYVDRLRHEKELNRNVRECACLLLESWGYELRKEEDIQQRKMYQEWQRYPVRLYKCGLSLLVFGQFDLYEKIKRYAKKLVKSGYSLKFSSKSHSNQDTLQLWKSWETKFPSH